MYTERFTEKQNLGLHKFEGSNRGRLLESERIVTEKDEEGNERQLYEYDVTDIDKIYTYEEKVEQLIREKYNVGEELAIQRQRLEKVDEFNEYFDFCEECKAKAKNDSKDVIFE